MDPRERFNDVFGTLKAAAESTMLNMWSAMPGIVESYNPAKGTVSVQITIRSVSQLKDGNVERTPIPLLTDVPVLFPQGGGAVITFPIAAGDECLVIFASRNIDSWWQSGGVQDQRLYRAFSLSDGFAFVGPRSLPRALSNVSGNSVQIRSADGSSGISLNPSTGRVDLTAPGGFWVNGIRFDTHKHNGVQIGSGQTTGPV